MYVMTFSNKFFFKFLRVKGDVNFIWWNTEAPWCKIEYKIIARSYYKIVCESD